MKDRTGKPITAEEAHFDVFMKGHRCNGCGSDKPSTRAQVFRLVEDLAPGMKEMISLEIRQGRMQPTWSTDRKPMIKISEVFACVLCTPNMERAAAQGKNSRDVVTFDRPPRPLRSLVVVA